MAYLLGIYQKYRYYDVMSCLLESTDDKLMVDLSVSELLIPHVANRPLSTPGFNALGDPSVFRLRKPSKKPFDNNALCRRW